VKKFYPQGLHTARTQRFLTQTALAQKLYISKQSISEWERGRSEPSLEMFFKLAEALDVPCAYLITEVKLG